MSAGVRDNCKQDYIPKVAQDDCMSWIAQLLYPLFWPVALASGLLQVRKSTSCDGCGEPLSPKRTTSDHHGRLMPYPQG